MSNDIQISRRLAFARIGTIALATAILPLTLGATSAFADKGGSSGGSGRGGGDGGGSSNRGPGSSNSGKDGSSEGNDDSPDTVETENESGDDDLPAVPVAATQAGATKKKKCAGIICL